MRAGGPDVSPTDVLSLAPPGPGGLLCGGAAGRQPVPAAGHGLGDHQGEGHPEQGQRRGVVPRGHPEGRPLRSEGLPVLFPFDDISSNYTYLSLYLASFNQ